MIIYKVTCLETNKIYIGKTVCPLHKRKASHIYDVKNGSQSYFHRAIRKYGKDSFVWEVLDKVMFSDLLLELEKFYIVKYNCKAPNGYNMTDGGDGMTGHHPTPEQLEQRRKTFGGKNNPFYGKHHSEETKKKISEAHKGMRFSPEAIAKMSAARKGDKNAFWGRHHTEETKKKISQNKSPRKTGWCHSTEAKEKISRGVKLFYENLKNRESA